MNAGAREELRISSSNADDGGADYSGDRIASLERKFTEYLLHIERMSAQLKRTSRQIESSVVGVCNSFQAIANRARTAVGRTSEFLSTEGTDTGNKSSFEGLIERCGRTLTRILETTEEAATVSRRAIERIHHIDAASQKIGSALAKLDQIANQNKILAMNARIEAAHAGELGAGFAVVAVEVSSQSDKTRDLTSCVGELINDLQEVAASTVNDLRQMAERDHARLKQSRKEVDDSLEAMRSTHRELNEMLSGMVRESALLANDIGSTVRQLQFQDRVSQQISHVTNDLDVLRARLGAYASSTTVSDDEGFSSHTMHEEREVAGVAITESPEGDIELF